MPKFMTWPCWKVTNTWNRKYCHCSPPICRAACYWLGQSPERRPSFDHSVRLPEGTEVDRFEDTSGRTHLRWGRQPDLMESTEFHDSSECLIPMLNAERWNWRPPDLHGPHGTLCYCSQWMSLRCRSLGAWSYPFHCCGNVSGGLKWPTRCRGP